MGLKGTLIACVVVSIASVLLTYNYTSNHYEAIISAEHERSALVVKQKTEEVLAAERKNNETTERLNSKALEQSKVVSNLQSQLASLRTVNNGLRIQSKCINSTTAIADGPPGPADATSPGTSEGVCELPAMFADTITATAKAADELRNRAEICKDFAEELINQRNRIINDNKE